MNRVEPTDGMVVDRDTVFEPGVYVLPKGVRVASDDITLDGNGATLVGLDREGVGVSLEGRRGVTLKNLKIRDYYHGIRAKSCEKLTLVSNQITGTAEIAPNTVFLDIWLGPQDAYGGAILLWDVRASAIEGNDLQHQMNGLLTYFCAGLKVTRNQANYNSGFGIHLYGTSDSHFEENSADYCCRFEPREGPLHFGHMGADATGFLLVYNSCRNVFRRNWARMGGDGFFVAGLTPKMEKAGCDDNLFEENDASLSPNIAFEATFCRGNVFRGNYADRCNYGFWLGYSWDTVIEGNRMLMNRQAGIGVEHGHGFQVRRNEFQVNGHGILLWSSLNDSFREPFPDSLTSHDWTIEDNVFTRNGKAIRIAADQDHGIRPAPEDRRGKPEARPHHHTIRKNDIQDNRVGVELWNTDHTLIEANLLHRNVEANIRQEDSTDVVARNNVGSAGAYL